MKRPYAERWYRDEDIAEPIQILIAIFVGLLFLYFVLSTPQLERQSEPKVEPIISEVDTISKNITNSDK